MDINEIERDSALLRSDLMLSSSEDENDCEKNKLAKILAEVERLKRVTRQQGIEIAAQRKEIENLKNQPRRQEDYKEQELELEGIKIDINNINFDLGRMREEVGIILDRKEKQSPIGKPPTGKFLFSKPEKSSEGDYDYDHSVFRRKKTPPATLTLFTPRSPPPPIIPPFPPRNSPVVVPPFPPPVVVPRTPPFFIEAVRELKKLKGAVTFPPNIETITID